MECRHCEQDYDVHQRTSYGNFCPDVDLSGIDWDDDAHPVLDALGSFECAWPQFVSAYEVSQGYGGPEEGGWWRDYFSPLESVRVDDAAEREAVLARLRERYELDADGRYVPSDEENPDIQRVRGRTSCAGGHDIWVCSEHQFAARSVNPSGGYE